MINVYAVETPLSADEFVLGGEKNWRIVATLDDEGCLDGECLIRRPDLTVVRGHLSNYRELRPHVPRDVYLALRQLKNAYQAEQSGMRGTA